MPEPVELLVPKAQGYGSNMCVGLRHRRTPPEIVLYPEAQHGDVAQTPVLRHGDSTTDRDQRHRHALPQRRRRDNDRDKGVCHSR